MKDDWISERTCPVCGGHAPNPDVDLPAEELCLPSRCPSWETVAVFDHDQRSWLQTDPDGFVLDGRRIEEVR